MKYAPITIFAYNRPVHLSMLIDSLLENPESKLSAVFIFVDGPKNEYDKKCIDEIKSRINGYKNELDIKVEFNSWNKGLSKSIISGVDKVLDTHERIIVLEDDLVLARNFLRFCNEGLSLYSENIDVASIQGYSPILFNPPETTYFLKGADCQGWATWRNRWSSMSRDSSFLLQELKSRKLSKGFDLDGSFPYTNMLERQALGKVDSWAIRWHASMFLQGKVSVYPGRPLVMNTGFDGSGTHKGSFGGASNSLPPSNYYPQFNDGEISESKHARSLVIKQARRRYKSYPYWHPKGFPRFIFRLLKQTLKY